MKCAERVRVSTFRERTRALEQGTENAVLARVPVVPVSLLS